MLYQRGRYRVEVAKDGAIKVRQGDWLTKYSAAIYGDFTMVDVFVRLDGAGRMVTIQNPNLIRTGETLYHLPTWQRHRTGRPSQPPPPKRQYTEKEKKLIEETLAKEFNLSGEHLQAFRKVLTYVNPSVAAVGQAVGTASVLAEAAGAIAAAGTLAGVAAACGIAGPFLLVVSATVDLANAWEFGERLAGFRAIAYGTTAWAFDDPMPQYPDAMRQEILRSGAHAAHPRNRPIVERHASAWNKARDSAVRNLDAEVMRTGAKKSGLQLVYRALGDGNKQSLVKLLMKGLEQQLKPGVERQAFWSPEPNYPL